MKIETHWEDVCIYFVEFRVKRQDGKVMKLHRTLVFKEFLKEKKVEQLILTKFSNVCSIDYIDLIDEMGLKMR